MDRLLRLSGILLIAALTLGNSQCQQSSSAIENGPAFVTTLSVEDANGNPASQFSQSQAIQFVISVHNRLDTPQTVVVAQPCSPPYYSAAVVQAGTSNVVFAGNNYTGLHCDLAVGPQGYQLTFAPDQTMTFTVPWQQTEASGQLVPPGNYEAMGGLICWDPPPGGGPSGSYDTVDCTAPGAPAADELTPTQYRSDLVSFTIQ
ncbi:MAG: hypothetical protein ACRETQ_04265 [Gammaproteobacteria bacterium]